MGDWGFLADQVMSQSFGDVVIPIRGRRILGLRLVHLSEGHLRYRACAVLHLAKCIIAQREQVCPEQV